MVLFYEKKPAKSDVYETFSTTVILDCATALGDHRRFDCWQPTIKILLVSESHFSRRNDNDQKAFWISVAHTFQLIYTHVYI